MENSDIQHTCILNVYTAAAKVCSRYQYKIENVKVLAILLTQSLLLQTCSYLYFFDALTVNLLFDYTDTAWVVINLICVISFVMRGHIVNFSITCKNNQAASKNMQNFIYFRLPNFESKLQNPT